MNIRLMYSNNVLCVCIIVTMIVRAHLISCGVKMNCRLDWVLACFSVSDLAI